MALRAFIDDSGSEPSNDFFVLAGYIAPLRKWEQFDVEWQAALDKAPRLDYFKSVEAMHMRGQFGGWDRDSRDARVIELANVVSRCCTMGVSASVRHADFRETLQRLPTFTGQRTVANDHPYVFLWFHMLSGLWLDAPRLGIKNGPCDFIFDEQLGFQSEAMHYWGVLKRVVESRRLADKNWIGSPPIFRDDKQFLPLQAADLWAWSNRRALCHSPDDLKLPMEAMGRLCAVPACHMEFTQEAMRQQAFNGARLMLKSFKVATSTEQPP